MRILVDAFGGDNAPSEIIKGAIEAINERDGFEVVLIGQQEVIEARLSELEYDKERVSIVDARDVITCEEEPTVAIRMKPNSSLCVAFKMLKEDPTATAFVSAGSTGAVLVGATLKVGRIRGVNRPALCPILPTAKGGNVLLLDCGANADCKAINLVDFALIGNEYAKCALKIEKPRVALLSNGTEDKKGNALTHEVFPMLKEMQGINFIGNIEARDILSGDVDVVVTDGFSGNVALKSIEGAVGLLMKMLKEAIYSGFWSKLGGLLMKGKMKKLKDTMDYTKNGGAVFLGVNKLIIKAHGSSKAPTIKASVLQAVDISNSGVMAELEQAFLAKVDAN